MILCPKCQTPCLDNIPGPRVDIIQALRSNLLPSRIELSQMQGLDTAESWELEQLEETIKDLTNRRDTLLRNIQIRKSWLAPIRRLPVEVLKEIFTHVVYSGLQNIGKFKFQFSLKVSSGFEDDYCEYCESSECLDCSAILNKFTKTTPFSLSQVCAHWRSVAIGTPSLWASLSLDVKGMDKDHVDLVELYLQRSAQYPLKIVLVKGNGGGKYAIGESGRKVLRSVVQELYRCREFHYDSDTYYLIDLIPEASRPKALPLLTTFSDRLGDADSRSGEWLWDLVKVAPRLVDVSVERFRPDRFPKNLRNLTIKRQREYMLFLEALPQLPNLVSLNLDDFTVWKRRGLPPLPLTPHPIHTRNLMITSISSLLNLDRLFSSVSLPSLSSLRICTREGTSDLGALRALIQRSGCSLKELTLDVGTYSSNALISLLELQPSLVALNLEMYKETELLLLMDLFARMSDPQSPLLPCVQRLDLHSRVMSSDEEFTETAVYAFDMVGSRVRQGKPVPKISLTFKKWGGKSKGLPVDLEKRVKELTKRGVECRIVFPSELRIGNWLKGDAEGNGHS